MINLDQKQKTTIFARELKIFENVLQIVRDISFLCNMLSFKHEIKN